MLIITFSLFVAGSAQSISADHLKSDGEGIFTSQNDVNLVSEKDSKYVLDMEPFILLIEWIIGALAPKLVYGYANGKIQIIHKHSF